MEEVVRPLYDAGLEKCEPCKSLFVGMLQRDNVESHNIEPTVFCICIIDVFEIVGDKSGINYAGVFSNNKINVTLTQKRGTVFYQRLADNGVEGENVIVSDTFTVIFQLISHATRATEGIKGRAERDVGDFLPDPIGELSFAPLLAGRGKLVLALYFNILKQGELSHSRFLNFL